MDEQWIKLYLDRIGAARPDVADAAALARLHRAHLAAVPFENLSIHLGEPIPLVPEADPATPHRPAVPASRGAGRCRWDRQALGHLEYHPAGARIDEPGGVGDGGDQR